MRKLVLALAAIAAFGFALPVLSNPAAADPVIVIKRPHDRGHHYGYWRHRDRDWAWRHRHHERDRPERVIAR